MKKDIKYIIKRVIIGVLIVLVLSFINKCDVKALTPSLTIQTNYDNGSIPLVQSSTSITCWGYPYTFDLTLEEYLYNFKLCSGNQVVDTHNTNGYHAILTPIDNSFKFYIVVYADKLYESYHGSDLNVASVDFVYENGGLNIKVYIDDGVLVEPGTWEYNLIHVNTFILTNKDIEKGISPSYLESKSLYPARYRDFVREDDYFRLAYTSWSDDSNFSSPLQFLPSKDLFNLLIKESSTIPLILIDDTPIDTLSIDNGLISGFDKGDSSNIFNSITSQIPDNWVLDDYIGFITIPFNFLTSLTSSTCSPISITLPHSNETVTLPCMKSYLQEKVPTLVNIIIIVVNGLLVYRITMRNIDTITDIIHPDDDKLEVVDL